MSTLRKQPALTFLLVAERRAHQFMVKLVPFAWRYGLSARYQLLWLICGRLKPQTPTCTNRSRVVTACLLFDCSLQLVASMVCVCLQPRM